MKQTKICGIKRKVGFKCKLGFVVKKLRTVKFKKNYCLFVFKIGFVNHGSFLL